MCLLLIAFRCHPGYPLVVAANRDEFYERPTRPLDRWPDTPTVFAGRDARSGGTWMGITTTGRLAAVTNFRERGVQVPDPWTRGELVADFLAGTEPPEAYLESVRGRQHRYQGFNLIVGTPEGIWYLSNRGGAVRLLPPGIFGLSNHLLDTPWPKVLNGKAGMAKHLKTHDTADPAGWFEMLADTTRPPDADLPDTGVGLEWERLLSPIFIRSDRYGTRSSTLLTVAETGSVRMTERTHSIPGGGNTIDRSFDWRLSPAVA